MQPGVDLVRQVSMALCQQPSPFYHHLKVRTIILLSLK